MVSDAPAVSPVSPTDAIADRDTGPSPEATATATAVPATSDNAATTVTQVADPAIQPDDVLEAEDVEDEFYAEDGPSTATTSVTSSIFRRNVMKNGRRYHLFHEDQHKYPIPNDEIEQHREDMKHEMMLALTGDKLFYAPIEDNPQLILDVGTGTGIWAIYAGEQYESAKVRGIDQTPIQPDWVPSNVEFILDDCEKEWLERDVDLAHFRFMVVVLRDVPKVLDNAYESLRPGGWIELQELNGEIFCDDSSMPEDDPVKLMYDLARQGFSKMGLDVTVAKKLGPLLTKAGFEDIQCVVKKVPIGDWAKDETLRQIGMYQKVAVLDLMPAFAGRPYEALGMSQVESQVVLAHGRRGLGDRSVHRYFKYFFWYAQKSVVSAGDE